MIRCNKPATMIATPAGFRACGDHITGNSTGVTWQPMGQSWRTDGTNPCDQPIETRENHMKVCQLADALEQVK